MANAKVVLETAFNQYQLGKVEGEGGAGRVWRSTDSSGQNVAIKILKKEAATSERRKRFKNEITFCQHNSHDNIVCVLDYGVMQIEDANTVPFFVMPLYAYSLRKILERSRDISSRLRYFGQILDGVEAAHLQGVTHRDLKPENILYDDHNDLVMVADFGIAHFTDEELYTAVETDPKARLANFEYSAPEQRTRGRIVDERSDIYSLGLILNELFTGQVAHGQDYKLVESISAEHMWIDEIVALMIQSAPDRRPQTIDEVKRHINSKHQEFVSRQRLSEVKKTVIPVGEEDDPLALEGPRIVDFTWSPNQLTLTFDRPINDGWIHGFHSMSNYTSLAGRGPNSFTFGKDRASIEAEESQVQKIIDYFKDWIPKATLAYRNKREEERSEQARDEASRLRDEQLRIEAQQRVRAEVRL